MNKLAMILSLAVVTAGTAVLSTPAMAGCTGCGGANAPEFIEQSSVIYGGQSHTYEVRAERGETMFVELYGYNWSDIDVIITDEHGREVAAGTSGESWEEFSWVARRAGVFTVEVVNAESTGCTEYDLSVY